MNKLTFYKISTGFLLCLNLVMLFFFFIKNRHTPHFSKPKHSAREEMGLNEAQHLAFEQSASKHKTQIQALHQQQENLLKSYFSALIKPQDTVYQDSIIKQVQEIEKNKMVYTYQHFEEVKTLLQPEQQKGFELFLERALGRIFSPQKNMPPPPHH